MIYQTKLNRKSGLSILEVLVVLAIFSILFAISTVVYSNLRSQNNLDITVSSVIEALRYARVNAQSVNKDLNWGLKVFPDKIVVFAGSTYTSRNTTYDETVNLSPDITLSGLTEIIFDKITGKTANFGTITTTNSSGSRNININTYGTISY